MYLVISESIGNEPFIMPYKTKKEALDCLEGLLWDIVFPPPTREEMDNILEKGGWGGIGGYAAITKERDKED